MKVSQWLTDDPVTFDIMRKSKTLKVNPEVFELLISKLRVNHPQYFSTALGLKARVTFKGYARPVQASVPYSDSPVEFYQWSLNNSDHINMTFPEKIKLFDVVYKLKPSILKGEHKKLIKKE